VDVSDFGVVVGGWAAGKVLGIGRFIVVKSDNNGSIVTLFQIFLLSLVA
jgi:hypothetical protein